MKKLILIFLIICSVACFGQGTFIKVNPIVTDGGKGGWNACVTLPAGYNPSLKYKTIVFFPGLGEIGTDPAKLVAYGPHSFIKQGGSIPDFIVISLQPVNSYPSEVLINNRLQMLKQLYGIDKFYLTGLSHGGWCATTFVTGDLLGGPYTYASQVDAVIEVEGVMPDDNSPYPQLWDNVASAGIKVLGFEQAFDNRGMPTRAARANAKVPGTYIYTQTNFGNGGHCCWDNFYGGHGTQPGKFMLNGKLQNMYEWMASVKGTVVPPVVVPPVIPPAPTCVLKSTYDSAVAANKVIVSALTTQLGLANTNISSLQAQLVTANNNTGSVQARLNDVQAGINNAAAILAQLIK